MYYRARYYNPSTGRFVSQDPIGFLTGDANLYRYVGNEATGATDPSGKEEWHHILVKSILLDLGLIGVDGSTTASVVGGSLNVHDKEHGILLAPEDHTRRDKSGGETHGIHCKRNSDGKTYETVFLEKLDDKLDSKGNIAYSDLLKLKDEMEAEYPEQFSRGEKPDHAYPSRDKWEDEMRVKRKMPPRASSKAARGTSASKTTLRVQVGNAASAVGDTLDGMKGVAARCNVGVTVASEAIGVIEAAKDVRQTMHRGITSFTFGTCTPPRTRSGYFQVP